MKPVEIELLLRDRASAGVRAFGNEMGGVSVQSRRVQRDLNEMNDTMQSMDKNVRRLIGAFAIKELVSKVANVRGEVQQLDVAFRTMLGSASKSDALLQQLVRTAAITPFGLQDVANGAKQLLAYGFDVEKVNSTLIQLGDIAAGLSIPLNDLVYLYGTTLAQGRLYTQDLNQFTNRGIPMISELAKQFGVAENKVKDLVEAGKVGFPEVQKVIESLTGESGKFGGLMEEQSKTITGQISNIEDGIFMMFNNIGQQTEGIISMTLSGVSYMVEHYAQFGRILLGLVGTYGVYRTALMTVTALKSWATAAEALHYNWLLLVEKAQKMLNATMLANPYVLIATLIAGVAAALISMKTETERLKEAEEDYQKHKEKVIEAEEEHRRKMEELCSIAGDEALSTDTRREALNKLEMKYPDIFAKYDTEYEKLKNIKTIKDEIAEIESKGSITRPENELASVNKEIEELEAKIKAFHLTDISSPIGVDPMVGMVASGLKTTFQRQPELKGLMAELKNLQNKRDTLQTQIRKNEVNAYFENLTGISNETLATEIKRRQNLLAKMSVQEKNYGNINQSTTLLNGTYSKDELQYQLNKLQSEQNRRNLTENSSADWTAAAKKKYQEALDEYNKFIADKSNSMTQEDFEKKAKSLKDAVEVAKKEYDKTKPETDKDTQSADRKQQREEREAARRLETERKLGLELVALKQANNEAETEAMDDGLKKKLKKIEDDYQSQKNALAKQKSDWQADNVKAGKPADLTEEQQKTIDEASDLNETKRQKAIAEAYQEEFALMRENLEKYGSYQQQKLAVATEYAERIKKANSDTERSGLEKERDSRLAGIKAQEIKSNVDWSGMLGEFGGMFNKILEPVLTNAKAYLSTSEFKNSDTQSQTAVLDAIQELERNMGLADKVSFKRLGDEITACQQAMVNLADAEDEYERCYNELKQAQEAYITAQKNGTAEEIEAAKQALANAEANETAAAKTVETLQSTADEAQRTVSTTATGLKTAMDNVVGGLQKLSSGSISGTYEGLIQMGKGMKVLEGMPKSLANIFGQISEKLENIPIIGWIVQIIDLFKDGVSVVIGGILDAVFSAVGGIIGDILNFKDGLFRQIGESLITGIGNILKSVFTFGGLFDWWGGGESDASLEKDVEYLTAANKDLAKSIDNLAKELSDGAVADATKVYEKQLNALEQSMQNTQEMMQRSAAAYSNGFIGIGGDHSSNYDINKGMSGKDWDRISIIVGREIRTAKDFFKLTSEEMLRVFNEAPDLYSKIKSLADDGYKDAAQYMDTYIGYAEQLAELKETLREKLTGTSFNTVRDEFKSMLLDMDADAQTAGANLEKSLFGSMIESLMSGKYDKLLKEWYTDYASAMEDGELNDEELTRLRNRYHDIVNDALTERNAIAEAMDYHPDSNDSRQSGKAGSFAAMSQDQGTKLEGLFVSVQAHTASIDEKLEDVTERWGTAADTLSRIEENTKKSAEKAEKILEKLTDMIRDGIKTR